MAYFFLIAFHIYIFCNHRDQMQLTLVKVLSLKLAVLKMRVQIIWTLNQVM